MLCLTELPLALPVIHGRVEIPGRVELPASRFVAGRSVLLSYGILWSRHPELNRATKSCSLLAWPLTHADFAVQPLLVTDLLVGRARVELAT